MKTRKELEERVEQLEGGLCQVGSFLENGFMAPEVRFQLIGEAVRSALGPEGERIYFRHFRKVGQPAVFPKETKSDD